MDRHASQIANVPGAYGLFVILLLTGCVSFEGQRVDRDLSDPWAWGFSARAATRLWNLDQSDAAFYVTGGAARFLSERSHFTRLDAGLQLRNPVQLREGRLRQPWVAGEVVYTRLVPAKAGHSVGGATLSLLLGLPTEDESRWGPSFLVGVGIGLYENDWMCQGVGCRRGLALRLGIDLMPWFLER